MRKLSLVNHAIRVYAQKNNLKPSWTDYRKWGKGKHIRLRFSKSGNEQIEELYATHYVSQAKVEEAKKRRESQKQNHVEAPVSKSSQPAARIPGPSLPTDSPFETLVHPCRCIKAE